MSIPSELLYLVVALAVGLALYRYFTTRGGIEILRPDYEGLPDAGQVEVRHHLVRWKRADGDSFVAAWQLESGHAVFLRVIFDGAAEDEPDLGHIDVRIDRREVVKGAAWTEKVRDRALRADVEAILRVLQREARVARSDRTRAAQARKVGDDRQPPDRAGDDREPPAPGPP
ncbi:MAG: hypothetical protein PVG27_12160 [Chloroflexota bacterium]